MKKVFAVMLALSLLITLTACVDYSDGEVKGTSNVVIGDDGEKREITINEEVLVDEAGVKITAKSLDIDEIFGPEIKLLIENDSGKDLTFQCGYASVNGYMVDTIMSTDVVNGKKANDSLTFTEEDLERCGIEAIADMEITFHIFETDDWDTYLDTDTIQIKTSIADKYEQTYDDSGELAYEGKGYKIIIKGLVEDDSIFGPGIMVYIENTSSKDITVQTRDVSINGFMVDGLLSSDVAAGKRAVDTITFMDSELEDNEITEIKEVEISFEILDLDDWDTIAESDVISITF